MINLIDLNEIVESLSIFINGLKSRNYIHNMTTEFVQFENKWGVNPSNPHKPTDFNKLFEYTNSSLGVNQTDAIEKILSLFDTHIEDVIKCIHCQTTNDDFEMNVRKNRLLQVVYYARSLYICSKNIHEALDISKDYRDCVDASLFRFRPIDEADNSKYQNFLLYILAYFHERNYRRYGTDIYKCILSSKGYNSYAWERVDSIQNVIYRSVVKETNYDQFLNVTNRSDSVRAATDFLSNCQDHQFSVLDKDRYTFSFDNGVYFAQKDCFVPYGKVPSSTVSCKYFNNSFPEDSMAADWRLIDTPFLDSILEYQDLSIEVIEWVYTFIGRMIYRIDEHDGWQVIPFMQGQAGTGKSTILLNVCKQLYDDEDVGVMSNNVQEKFGLADLVDKIIFIAPEIKRDFKIEQGEFQSIVSGDKVTINIKHKQSRFVNWDIPGIMAGNEIPDFIDNSGSIQRRMVTVKFNNRVTHSDLMLGQKIKDEMPKIIAKCNKCYREYAARYGRENIWVNLPEYFRDTQRELAAATNPLIHYLASGKLRFNPDSCISMDDFVLNFNNHCSENNYKKQRFNPDFYIGPFTQYKINVEKGVARKYRGRTIETTFLIGIDTKTESYESFDEDGLQDL